MRVMMGRLFSAFPTNCGPRRCHALTHSSQPAFTSPPSSDLLILRGRTHWYGYGHGTRSTHAASYQACFPCCRSMRHRGWMYVCMYVQYSVAAEVLLLVKLRGRAVPVSTSTPSLNSVPLWRRPTL
ncbi:hypothetical protein J3E69DRAFT_342545, partial [Trichoderma sp. SZMC 28015]